MKLLVLICLVVGCTAQCNTLQRLLVKKEWSAVFGTGLDREAFGTRVWRSMYEIKPDTRRFFTRVSGDNLYSPAFQAHSQRVLGGLDMCIALLDDTDTLAAQLDHLQRQHIQRGITQEYFEALHSVILDEMPAVMGAGFHDLLAWSECLGYIRSGIQSL